MILVNRASESVIHENIHEAATFKEKSKGLISASPQNALIMSTRWGIHTFGLKFPIHVMILNKKNQVIQIKQWLRPGHFFFWNPIHSRIIEIPALDDLLVQKNDELQII